MHQIIPKNAIEEINKNKYSENDISAYYFVNGEKIAYRAWDENQIYMEYEIKNEKKHGLFRVWHDNGNLWEESFYV
ncbi:MAG: hypothetical protein ACYTXE_42215, partial [Nostoc sp.]